MLPRLWLLVGSKGQTDRHCQNSRQLGCRRGTKWPTGKRASLFRETLKVWRLLVSWTLGAQVRLLHSFRDYKPSKRFCRKSWFLCALQTMKSLRAPSHFWRYNTEEGSQRHHLSKGPKLTHAKSTNLHIDQTVRFVQVFLVGTRKHLQFGIAFNLREGLNEKTSPKIGPSRCARFVFVSLCKSL